jgi:hypothetical protein
MEFTQTQLQMYSAITDQIENWDIPIEKFMSLSKDELYNKYFENGKFHVDLNRQIELYKFHDYLMFNSIKKSKSFLDEIVIAIDDLKFKNDVNIDIDERLSNKKNQ